MRDLPDNFHINFRNGRYKRRARSRRVVALPLSMTTRFHAVAADNVKWMLQGGKGKRKTEARSNCILQSAVNQSDRLCGWDEFDCFGRIRSICASGTLDACN